MSIQLYDKVKLKMGKIVKIVEVLGDGAVFVVEIYKDGEGLTIEQVYYEDIVSVIKEVEYPLLHAS